jgi:hypothetical protein
MPGCNVQTASKYQNRPSVPRKANDPSCRGKRFLGNNGLWYISTPNVNNIYRWVIDRDQSAHSIAHPAQLDSTLMYIDLVDEEENDDQQPGNNPTSTPPCFHHVNKTLRSLYDSREGYNSGTQNRLPCPRISKDKVDRLSSQELYEMWGCLEDVYCIAIDRAECLGAPPSDITTLRQMIKYLTGTRAQNAWVAADSLSEFLDGLD